MITRRDLVVASASIFITVGAVALAQSGSKPIMHSRIFDWNEMKAEQTKTGERRSVFDAPTATLDQFECHITTLNPGESPHAPHRHPEEELMIVKEGTLETMQNGVTNRIEAGGIIFQASNEFHGARNIGTNRATYFVFKFYPHGLAGGSAK
jgi:quercetin dioxygenase-like cupin family protein